MTHIANRSERRYRSELRAKHADDTRAEILDAAVRVMAAGVATLSVPAVAREARVSIATVYRHFKTKGDLLAAVYPHIERRANLGELVVPRTIDDLRPAVVSLFTRLDAFDDLARAAMASPAAAEARALSMPRRLAIASTVVDSIQPAPSKVNRDRIVRLLVILTSSAAVRTWRDHLGATGDEAAADIDWIVRAAVAASTQPASGPRRQRRARDRTK